MLEGSEVCYPRGLECWDSRVPAGEEGRALIPKQVRMDRGPPRDTDWEREPGKGQEGDMEQKCRKDGNSTIKQP